MAILSYFSCTTTDVAGGSSSTDNGKIVGMICTQDGLPAADVRVFLRPADFDPCRDDTASIYIDTTDSAGKYEFDRLATAVYTIEAVSEKAGTRALVTPIDVDSATTNASPATLAEPAVIEIHSYNNCDSFQCYAYIPGTSHYSIICKGIGFIDSVPPGMIPAIRYAEKRNNGNSGTIKSSFLANPGVRHVIADYSLWKYSKKVFLNTTSKGADVKGDVFNFPVLIRLSSADFDFEHARIDGGDIRFKKPDDTPLPYEIELWDLTKRKAAIWVRVDTVYGDNSNQYFTMFWGNPDVVSESDGKAVFDTSIGFQGVWHFNDQSYVNVIDATANNYHGTPRNITASAVLEGIAGNACRFNGSTSYIVMQNTASSRLDFPEDGNYSMSLWVYADTIDTLWHAIAGKGHEQYYMQFKCFGKNRATWEFVEFQENRGWEYSEDSVPPAPGAGEWLYLVGVRSGTDQRLYINGGKVVDGCALMPGNYPRNRGDDFHIGRFGRQVAIPYYQGWSYFRGRIDEVRVSSISLTDDWIKLSYMNQKEEDALVSFGQ